jgi:hypothetical protein
MNIKFKTDCELTLVTHLDESQEPQETTELFKSGEILNCEFVDYPERFISGELQEDRSLWNIQLGDGSMIFGVSVEWFDVIPE